MLSHRSLPARRAAGVLTLLALIVVDVSGSGSVPRARYAEDADGTFRTTEAVTRKEHWARPGEPDAWYFCFDHTDGGWTCVPVTAADYRRYRVGQHVDLRQQVGQLAQLRS